MHDIYFFNGQDITMNVCIQIHRVINLIQEQENIDFEEATGKFYHSQTYKTLTQLKMVCGQKMQNIFWIAIMKKLKIKRR